MANGRSKGQRPIAGIWSTRRSETQLKMTSVKRIPRSLSRGGTTTPANAIGVERRIAAQDGHALVHGLRREQSVEGVTMVPRQRTDPTA